MDSKDVLMMLCIVGGIVILGLYWIIHGLLKSRGALIELAQMYSDAYMRQREKKVNQSVSEN